MHTVNTDEAVGTCSYKQVRHIVTYTYFSVKSLRHYGSFHNPVISNVLVYVNTWWTWPV